MLHAHTGGVKAIVRNTEMTNHINYNSEKMVFENVLFTAQLKFLTQPHPEKDLGYFDHTFKNCKANLQNMVVATNKGKLSGEIKFTNLTLSDVAWEKGEITREYPVIVKYENNNPISNAELELYDKNNQLVWSGSTNEEGKAYFEIKFGKSNYEDKWELKLAGESELHAEIGFLSDTPIEIVK